MSVRLGLCCNKLDEGRGSNLELARMRSVDSRRIAANIKLYWVRVRYPARNLFRCIDYGHVGRVLSIGVSPLCRIEF